MSGVRRSLVSALCALSPVVTLPTQRRARGVEGTDGVRLALRCAGVASSALRLSVLGVVGVGASGLRGRRATGDDDSPSSDAAPSVELPAASESPLIADCATPSCTCRACTSGLKRDTSFSLSSTTSTS